MSTPDGVTLSEGETATVEAIKILIDIIQDAGIASATAFDVKLESQRDAFASMQMPKAAAMMAMLRQFACDPARMAEREKSYHRAEVQEGSS